jgi:8-hydroxy-5-deazaflavin:NADPH oxidoreductase
MKIGILGSGGVAQTLGTKLAELGHEVMLGTRDVEGLMARTELAFGQAEPFAAWSAKHPQIRVGTFAETAAHGELLINATAGTGSLEALARAGEDNLNGKVLLDVSNPLDFSQGFPPFLSVANQDSLGEQLQRAFPQLRVVKSLNTVTAAVMVNPRALADGDHHMFVCGDDAEAKATVNDLLTEGFGWRHVVDLGGISAARGMEMYLPLWLNLMGNLGTPMFNLKLVRIDEGVRDPG